MSANSDHSELTRLFAESAQTSAARAPLYSSLSEGIARTPAIAALLDQAPPTQRLPVLLFAVVHHLVLGARTEPLAAWYPNITDDHRAPDDPELLPIFAAFVDAHAAEIAELLATRTTQTNEAGRCALFMPVFSLLAEEVGPLGHLDVGTSAGLTLLTDAYQYRYRTRGGDETTTVGDRSPVVIEAETIGAMPLPATLPPIAGRCGIDRSPIDVTSDEDAGWLEACVWPDQTDRFRRLVAAIDIARSAPPDILEGDAVDLLADGIERVGHGHPVVTNSWVLNYFTSAARVAYLAELERIGAERDLSWVYAEAPALIPELPNGPDPKDPHLTVLSLARWRNGRRTVEHLATCHPHGYWLHWR